MASICHEVDTLKNHSKYQLIFEPLVNYILANGTLLQSSQFLSLRGRTFSYLRMVPVSAANRNPTGVEGTQSFR